MPSTPRHPTAAVRSLALPSLAALTLAGVLAEGCMNEAYAQQRPDAGVRPQPRPPTPPVPGGIRPVQPPPPPPPPPPPQVIPGGISAVGPIKPRG